MNCCPLVRMQAINDNSTEVWPDLSETLFQLIDITQAYLIDSVLKTAQTL